MRKRARSLGATLKRARCPGCSTRRTARPHAFRCCGHACPTLLWNRLAGSGVGAATQRSTCALQSKAIDRFRARVRLTVSQIAPHRTHRNGSATAAARFPGDQFAKRLPRRADFGFAPQRAPCRNPARRVNDCGQHIEFEDFRDSRHRDAPTAVRGEFA